MLTDTSLQFIIELWNESDLILKIVACSLFIMSIVSWTVALLKCVQLAKVKREGSSVRSLLDSTAQGEGLTHIVHSKDNLYSFIIETGLRARRQYNPALAAHISFSDWILDALRSALDTGGEKLQQGLSSLATIGAMAPFVGLFGTVYGIYKALMGLSDQSTAHISAVAGPIGEALIMTAVGLAVAIPAVVFFNILTRQVAKIKSTNKHFAKAVYPHILMQESIKESGGTAL